MAVTGVPRAAAPIAALAAAVLVVATTAAATLSGGPQPAAAQPTATSEATGAPSPSPSPPPAVVALAVRPPAPAPVAHDPGDPTTWPSRQLAAQLVFSCVHTSNLGAAAAHASAGVGGIVLLGEPTDAAALTATLAGVRGAAPHGIAPLLASDEEGGRVQRLKGILGPLPAAAEMGGWSDARIEQTAHHYGVRMRGLGIAMALSPVADLAVPGGHPDDTGRAFSADPHRVAGAAVAWSRGLERAGVLSAVKHWPGHGHGTDSHSTAPSVPPLPALEGSDLLPFDAVARSGASVVMVGHLRSEGLTEPGLPATLSPHALRVLRERAGPDAVVLTDSVSMAAASSALGLRPAEAAVRALQAGADWAMSCVDPLAAVDEVQAALDAGRWSRDAAVASARRVLAAKQRLGLLATPLATAAPVGSLDAAESADGHVRLHGRAADPDTAAPPRVRVLRDGVAVHEVVADRATQAFTVEVPAGAAAEVCAEALNTGAGRSTPLGCVSAPA